MIVGEAPGAEEERHGRPFIGTSGRELDKMLHEAGIMRSEVFVSNICRIRPPNNEISAWISFAKKKASIPVGFVQMRNFYVHPNIKAGFDKLLKEIELVKPNIIIAFGNLSMWALTGTWGISKWRGSQLRVDWDQGGPKVVPTYHPAYILRDWAERAATVRDMRRAGREQYTRDLHKPQWIFVIRPTFDRVVGVFNDLLRRLDSGPLKLTHDLETRHGHIACSGIAWSKTEAICVPFMCVEDKDGYWSAEQEAAIIWLHYKVLCHPNARVVNHNYLYDAQYTYRWWCFVANFYRDTMTSHHTLFCELPKRIEYPASMHCEYYRFWKDDGKEWNPKIGEDQLWYYNCEDCVRTYEIDDSQEQAVERLKLQGPHDFQQKQFFCTLRTVNYGFRLDPVVKQKMASELAQAAEDRMSYLEKVLGHPLNVRSPQQMQSLFYQDLQQPIVFHKASKRPTLDDNALQKIAKREPLLRPIVKKISELRSIGVFVSTFINAKLDFDGRLRCSLNPNGTYTFRYSSSESAFWNGTNLQNVPKGVEAAELDDLELPNIRKLFIPDEGFTYFDMDLDRADLQVVVWEADDKELKQMLREGVDVHTENAKLLGCSRFLAKVWVHGTDYGGGPRTMATECGITVHQADLMQRRWFMAHPGIKAWHERTAEQAKKGYIENIFGYRWYLFNRLNLPDALAWQPQSVVGRVINTAWQRIHDQAPYIQVLLQVHDSLAGQFPTHHKPQAIETLRKLAAVEVPYPDPLVIPVGIKTSEESWGACH